VAKKETRKKKEKPAIELTTDEAMQRLFPKKVVDRLREEAHKNDPPEEEE
jgi:hypothetical protein